MRSKTLRVGIILLTLFSLAIILVSAPPPPPTPPTISFVGVEAVTGGTKFTYHVKRGSDPLNWWELYSNAFLVYDVIDSSETCHSWDNKDYIRFTDPYKNAGDERDVWFVLNIDYTGLVLADIDYLLKSTSEEYVGKILGPSTPDFVIPETSWGTLGAMSPMIIVAFALVLFRTRAVKFIRL